MEIYYSEGNRFVNLKKWYTAIVSALFLIISVLIFLDILGYCYVPSSYSSKSSTWYDSISTLNVLNSMIFLFVIISHVSILWSKSILAFLSSQTTSTISTCSFSCTTTSKISHHTMLVLFYSPRCSGNLEYTCGFITDGYVAR